MSGPWEEGWPVTVVQGLAWELASGFRGSGGCLLLWGSCGQAVSTLHVDHNLWGPNSRRTGGVLSGGLAQPLLL